MREGFHDRPPRRWWLLAVAVAALLAAAGLYTLAQGTDDEVGRALSRRGKLLVVGEAGWLPRLTGTSYRAASQLPKLDALVLGDDAAAFASALKAQALDGVLLDPADHASFANGSVAATLLSAGSVRGLVGTYLSEELVLYGNDRLSDMPKSYSRVLATVARRMLAGERAPRVQSFPELLRRVQHVEVMVLLRAGPRPRLWRSARGSSIARAFLTAVRVAGRRWREREQAMGESLEDALPHLTVEISLLRDDGEIGTRDPAFIDRVVTKDHGVAYELKGSWRYLLPKATQEQGEGSPTRALSQLLEDSGLPADAYKEPFVRISRLRVHSLGISEPERPKDALARPDDPARALVP